MSVPETPLEMTIHGLPPLQSGAAEPQRRRSGRWKMLAVFAVCAAPVVASYFTYYVLRPGQQRSFGELIAAQPELPSAMATALDGTPLPLQSLKGQWLLLSVAGGACGDRCESNLYLQRQLRETLGREKDRLDRVWLIPDDAPVAEHLRPALAQATVLRVPEAVVRGWLQPAPGRKLEDHLYVVDPQGRWMMRMPAGLDKADAGKAKRDLDRLLRASASWDAPGRPGDGG
ncbi:Uncharacterised protein [Delftia tsuruhatensis]|uniref:hypothetical protein n=1 Tax=Delftia tsuruhatensis TaxID=180282 RepID=UPI001E775D00|nr:hypothetical protein [Delftia tsuruhatensis]CAB5688532.1 Uncharacterised protein [Delftia tsuruhatensis]CAC9690947.1 Uncharacterised protein [Delftia tsuruhatensis]